MCVYTHTKETFSKLPRYRQRTVRASRAPFKNFWPRPPSTLVQGLTSLTRSWRRRVMTCLEIAIIKLQHIAKDRHEWHELLSGIIHVVITARDAHLWLVLWFRAVSDLAAVCLCALKVSARVLSTTFSGTWHYKHCLHAGFVEFMYHFNVCLVKCECRKRMLIHTYMYCKIATRNRFVNTQYIHYHHYMKCFCTVVFTVQALALVAVHGRCFWSRGSLILVILKYSTAFLFKDWRTKPCNK